MDKFILPEGYCWEGNSIVLRAETESGIPQAHRVVCVDDAELFAHFIYYMVRAFHRGDMRLAPFDPNFEK